MTGAEVRAVAVRVAAEAEEQGPGRGEAGGSSSSPPPEHTRQAVSGMGQRGHQPLPGFLQDPRVPSRPFATVREGVGSGQHRRGRSSLEDSCRPQAQPRRTARGQDTPVYCSSP